MVQTAKENLLRMGSSDWSLRLARMLFAQHSTPHSATGKTPAELLMGRQITTALNRLHPDLDADINARSEEAYRNQPSAEKLRSFNPGDEVYARNYASGPAWVPGNIEAGTGPKSYIVQTNQGQFWRRHIDQLRARTLATVGESGDVEFGRAPLLAPALPPLPPSSSEPNMPQRRTSAQQSPRQDVNSPQRWMSDQQSPRKEVNSPQQRAFPERRQGEATLSSPALSTPTAPSLRPARMASLCGLPPTAHPASEEQTTSSDEIAASQNGQATIPTELRRSERARKRPRYLSDFV